ncbi:NAD(P)-dependent oxidoreductase [Streptomyces sp. NRRL WC-3742]|uniref:NAD(P)-dependent oxidoreductase n=1 Tax=Streptomyces sp. NRRL WC-3742 TaxID=1463934 RepID=UPI00068A571E|nr:NAD(P)-dependent oxidoreductase [Streptomyces sp. NRRL WC-3742]
MTDRQVTLGVLHPGSMGAAVAGCALANSGQVLWCPQGRSTATAARADRFGLTAVPTLDELVARADVVLSLCPPATAEDVARDVAGLGFTGLYVEANAISPQRAARIAQLLGGTARAVVDGAVIGSPPVGTKQSRLYLSGSVNEVGVVEQLFSGSAVSTHVLGEEIGQASALKVAYSVYQKTSRVLAALSYGLAREHGVDQALLDVAGQRAGSYLTETGYIGKTAARSWRWGPELEEAADTMAAAGLPDDLLRSAASTLSRWNNAKGTTLSAGQALDELLRAEANLSSRHTGPEQSEDSGRRIG